MDVSMIVLLVRGHGLDDGVRLLRGRGAVEVGKPVAIDLLLQDREILPVIRNLLAGRERLADGRHADSPCSSRLRRSSIDVATMSWVSSMGDFSTIVWANARVSICRAAFRSRPRVRR